MWSVRSATSRLPESKAVEPAPDSGRSSVDAAAMQVRRRSRIPPSATAGPAAPPAPVSRDPGATPSAGTPRFAVRMATFRTKARHAIEAIRELGAAVTTPSALKLSYGMGRARLRFLLGPYADRAAAAEDLAQPADARLRERARGDRPMIQTMWVCCSRTSSKRESRVSL